MEFKTVRNLFLKNKDIVFLLAVFFSWLVIRQALKIYLCSSTFCWLEPSDWPILLGVGPDSAGLFIAMLAFILFAAPTGWASIVATFVGIDLMLGNGFSVLKTTALFSISTSVSLFLTWHCLLILFVKPGSASRLLTGSGKSLFKRLRVDGRAGLFWFLSIGNAFSSQIHIIALAHLMKVRFHFAFPPLFLGSLASFFIPMTAFFSSKVLTLDGVLAAFLGLGIFILSLHLAVRDE